MKYMLLIYDNPGGVEAFTGRSATEFPEEIDELMPSSTATGELVGGEALADRRTPGRSGPATASRL